MSCKLSEVMLMLPPYLVVASLCEVSHTVLGEVDVETVKESPQKTSSSSH